jgi:hypothetical protein
VSESRADRVRPISAEIDEANRHGYVHAAEMNGTHIGKGLWDFGDAEWREIAWVAHDREGAAVVTIPRGATWIPGINGRWHRSTDQIFDVTAHPISDSRTTEQATPDLPTTEGEQS